MKNSDYPKLNNAPVQEAIISLSIEREIHPSIDNLTDICENLKPLYPQSQTWQSYESGVHFNEQGIQSSHKQTPLGFVLKSADNLNLLHLSQDTLVMNRLKPYTNWEEFVEQYGAAWQIYTSQLKIDKIKSTALRFINTFDIPIDSWESYLTMRPSMNTTTQQDESHIFMGDVFSRYNLMSIEYDANAVVMLTLKAENSQKLKVIMDIEVTTTKSILYHDFLSFQSCLNRLRNFKNQIFFANLPKAEELFK